MSEEIERAAFNFVDHFVIWREHDGQYILNGHPEEMEEALRLLLTEQRGEENENVSTVI